MASSMGPAKMVTDGLVLYLDAGNNKSYPGSGTVWTDLSSTAITGSLTNGPTFSSTVNGTIRFDGTNDNVEISNNTNLNPVKEFTLGCWVNVSSLSTTFLGIVDKYNGISNNGYVIDIPNGGGSRPLSKFRFVNCAGASYAEVITTGSLATGSWYNVVGTYDGVNITIYVNGVADGNAPLTGNNVIDTGSLRIGGDGVSTNYLSCSISQVTLHNRALSAAEVFQNYEATRERFNRPTIVTDDDARNFLNSANISSETQQRAVNDLVVDLKNTGLWGKMKAIYPFVGGTATTHKWNLKDPRDVDAAFRLTFTGGWTHSSTGATPNGTNAYADTYLIPTTTLTENNTHLSYYSRTNQYTVSEEISLYKTGATPASLFRIVCGGLADGTIPYYGGEMYSTVDYAAVGFDTPISNSTLGHYILSRTSNVYHSTYRNGIFTQTAYNPRTTVASGWANCNIKLWIAARNSNGTPGIYSNKQAAFASIGDGLTNTDAANLYTIVQKYQTTLGRQV